MAKEKKAPLAFPKHLLVKHELDGDEVFFVAAANAQDLAVEGEKVKVARYVLAGEGIVHTYTDYIEGAKD